MSSHRRSPGRAAPPPGSRGLVLALCASSLLATGSPAADGGVAPPLHPGQPYRYRPKLGVSDSLRPFLEEITPGSDLFPDERVAGKLIARLSELGAKLRESPDGASRVAELLLAPSFRGGRLRPVEEVAVARHPSLQVFRAEGWPRTWSSTPDPSPGSCASCSRTSGRSRSPSFWSPLSTSNERKGSREPTCATTSWARARMPGGSNGRASGDCAGGAPHPTGAWSSGRRPSTSAAAPRPRSSPRSRRPPSGRIDSFRRQLEHRLRRLGRDARLGVCPRLERPPRRLGRGRGRRRPRRHLRRPAARVSQPALPGPG